MSGESRRSREAVRNSVRTYGVKVMDPASLPLKKTNERESQESFSRFSEKSLHSQYRIRDVSCKSFLQRIPYATLLACILCVLGIVIFSTGRRRVTILKSAMLKDVLREDDTMLHKYDIILMVVEISTVVKAAMILIIGILATGDTRAQVYRAGKARVGGRICCSILMFLTIVFFFLWLLVFWLFATLFYIVTTAKTLCDLYSNVDGKQCLHLAVLNTYIKIKKEDIVVCSEPDVKKFCKDYVEKVSASFVAVGFGNLIVIFSLVLFLICLAANYARIRCQAKFQELEELRHLEGDLHNSKDRF